MVTARDSFLIGRTSESKTIVGWSWSHGMSVLSWGSCGGYTDVGEKGILVANNESVPW
jgi:hypothetical protein